MRRILPLLSLLFVAFAFFVLSKTGNDRATAEHNSSDDNSALQKTTPENPPLKFESAAASDTFLLPDSLASIETLLVARKSAYRMQLYHKGTLVKTYVIGLGQEPIGHKEMQGDNRTPEGMYKIIQKSRGPFTGDYSQYLGVAWIRLNYPNNADAIAGYKKRLITEAQKNAIIAANDAGKEPPKNTKLGGGIGIHGWYGSWPGCDKQNLTWGCISVQNADLDDLYDRVNIGTTVVILAE